MYCRKNFATKKELIAEFKSGRPIYVFQPGPFGGGSINGNVCLEGPHYPQPHKWYASAEVQNCVVVKVK